LEESPRSLAQNAYAKKAQAVISTLEDYEKQAAAASAIVPFRPALSLFHWARDGGDYSGVGRAVAERIIPLYEAR
jgi:hypothetical protein